MENKINALIIKNKDSVAVVIEDLTDGEVARYKIDGEIKAIHLVDDIPIYHKVALCDIAEGEEVYKYGESIGRAIKPIKAGQHVHSHNLISIREAIE